MPTSPPSWPVESAPALDGLDERILDSIWDSFAGLGAGRPLIYAAAHAPRGGVTIGGKRFTGGQFIPAEVMADASPEERAAVESGEARQKPLPPPGGAKLKEPPKQVASPKWYKEPGNRGTFMMVPIDSVIGVHDEGHDLEASARHAAGLGRAIEKSGKVQALSAVPIEDGRFRIIDGKHRLAALKAMGVTEVGIQVQPTRRPQIDPGSGTAAPAPPSGPVAPTSVRFDSPAAFADSLAAAYAAGGMDPTVAKSVTDVLPSYVVQRLAAGRLKTVAIHPSEAAVTKSWADGADAPTRELAERYSVSGFYDWDKNHLESNGGSDPRGTLAHEIGHALDSEKINGALSDTDEFRYYWSRELKGGGLSDYAATEPAEGFAEFVRFLYGSGDDPKKQAELLAQLFPGTYSFFQKHGLV